MYTCTVLFGSSRQVSLCSTRGECSFLFKFWWKTLVISWTSLTETGMVIKGTKKGWNLINLLINFGFWVYRIGLWGSSLNLLISRHSLISVPPLSQQPTSCRVFIEAEPGPFPRRRRHAFRIFLRAEIFLPWRILFSGEKFLLRASSATRELTCLVPAQYWIIAARDLQL